MTKVQVYRVAHQAVLTVVAPHLMTQVTQAHRVHQILVVVAQVTILVLLPALIQVVVEVATGKTFYIALH